MLVSWAGRGKPKYTKSVYTWCGWQSNLFALPSSTIPTREPCAVRGLASCYQPEPSPRHYLVQQRSQERHFTESGDIALRLYLSGCRVNATTKTINKEGKINTSLAVSRSHGLTVSLSPTLCQLPPRPGISSKSHATKAVTTDRP